MKANELMVGDYVLYDGLILEVGGLTDYDIKIDLLKGNEIYAQFWDEDMDNIQGIPITPEILEKNGFINYGETWYVPADTDGNHIMVGFHRHETIFEIYKKHIFSFRKDYEPGEAFVHELQHALRLCGIDKEIIV